MDKIKAVAWKVGDLVFASESEAVEEVKVWGPSGSIVECLYDQSSVDRLLDESESNARMLVAACSALGEIDRILGIGADACGDPQETVSALLDYIAGVSTSKEEAQSMKSDAHRYRWIRSNVYPSGFFGRKGPHVVMSVYFGHDEKGNQLLMHPGKESKVGIPDLDTAIDRAMEGKPHAQQD